VCLLILVSIFILSRFFFFPASLASSIYPGRGGPLDSIFPVNDPSDEEDFQVEDEDDWMGDEEPVLAKSARNRSSKFSKLVASEVSTTMLVLSHILN
jgi:hypothetical protein